jgi:DNA primase
MAHYFDDEFLRRLRNDIPWALLLQRLRWPHKQRHGQLAFLCPRCQEYLSAVNPRTNLGRCFHCGTNFNPIDFVIQVQDCDFVTAVSHLKRLLPHANH